MSIEKQDIEWSDAAVFICEKCGKSLDGLRLKEDGNASENLKKWLKSKMKDSGHGKQIRVMNSGCLDVCIKNEVAVAYLPVNTSTNKAEVMTVHPEEDREELFAKLVKTLK